MDGVAKGRHMWSRVRTHARVLGYELRTNLDVPFVSKRSSAILYPYVTPSSTQAGDDGISGSRTHVY